MSLLQWNLSPCANVIDECPITGVGGGEGERALNARKGREGMSEGRQAWANMQTEEATTEVVSSFLDVINE